MTQKLLEKARQISLDILKFFTTFFVTSMLRQPGK